MKPVKLKKTKSTIRFNTKLFQSKANGKIGSWTFLILPKNASAKLLSSGTMMVEGIINGFPFRAALEPNGKKSHRLKINKSVHDAAKAGDMIMVEITRIGEESETRVPVDLRKALAAAPRAQVSWADITPISRRDWIFWIISAKQSETRRNRIEKACAMLASGKRRVCCFGGIKWLMKNHAAKKPSFNK